MELGGNAPFIIFDSANLEKAVNGVMACKFRCSGQVNCFVVYLINLNIHFVYILQVVLVYLSF